MNSADPPPGAPDRAPGAVPGGGPEEAAPAPLVEEIAQEGRGRRPGGGAVAEVRIRRLVLLLAVLVPLIWWIVSTIL